MTPAQYLEYERSVEPKHEYVDGEIRELLFPTPPHGVIVGNVSFTLNVCLNEKRHRVFTNNLRVSAHGGQLLTYPAIVVIKDEPQWFDNERDTLINPGLVVEVLSLPANDYDRATARGYFYRTLSSLPEYLVVDSSPVFVEHWRRLPNGNWELATIRDRGATLRLESLGCEIPVSEIYQDVERFL